MIDNHVSDDREISSLVLLVCILLLLPGCDSVKRMLIKPTHIDIPGTVADPVLLPDPTYTTLDIAPGVFMCSPLISDDNDVSWELTLPADEGYTPADNALPAGKWWLLDNHSHEIEEHNKAECTLFSQRLMVNDKIIRDRVRKNNEAAARGNDDE